MKHILEVFGLMAMLGSSIEVPAHAEDYLDAIPINQGFKYQLDKGIFASHWPTDTSPFRVWYRTEQTDGHLTVRARFRYLEFLANSDPVTGVANLATPFTWRPPILLFRISNTTSKAVYLTTARFVVKQSVVDYTPIPVFQPFEKTGKLTLVNEGWGPLRKANLSFAVLHNDLCLNPTPRRIDLKTISMGDVAESFDLDLSHGLVPKALANEAIVCVVGRLSYTDDAGKAYSIPYTTAVNLIPPGPGAGVAPTASYTLKLDAGRSNYIKELPISQKIEPNGADLFLVNVVSDRSADFQFSVAVTDTEGNSIGLGDVSLYFFRPRSMPRDELSYEAYTTVAVPDSLEAGARAYVLRIARNPEKTTELAVFMTKSWELLQGTEKDVVTEKILDSIQHANVGVSRYCLVNVDDECVRSGEIGVH